MKDVFIVEELVRKAKDGDENALGEIINKFNYFVIKHASRYKVPSYDLDDLIQHGFLSIIKAVHQYRLGSNNFTTYCNNAVVNNYNALLKGQIKHYREIQNEELLSIQPYQFTLEDEVIAHEETKKMIQALKEFDDIEKSIINGVYFENKTLKEVAITCNINYRKAMGIKKKTLNKLRFFMLIDR